MNENLNEENSRLMQKKQSVDAAYDAHKRNQMYKSSQSFRMNAYRKMSFVALFIIIVLVGVFFLSSKLPVTVSFLLGFLVLIVGSYYLLSIYTDVERRDKFDYNKVSSNYLMSTSNLDQTTGSNLYDCIGEQCCDEGEFFKDGTCQAEYHQVQELGELNYAASPWGSYDSIPHNSNSKWIWNTMNSDTSAAGDSTLTFVRSWNNTYSSSIDAVINILVDNRASIRVNGNYIAEHVGTTHGKYPVKLKAGLNTFEVRANNTGSAPNSAGLFITVSRTIQNTDPAAQQPTTEQVLLSTNQLWKFTRNIGYITETVWANLDGRYAPGEYERLTGGNPISNILTKDDDCDRKCATQQECKTTECKHYLDKSTNQCFCRAKVPYESVYPVAATGTVESFQTNNTINSFYKKPTYTKI
jgi:hypothetical protein